MHVIRIKSNIRDYSVYFPESADFIKSFERFSPRFYVVDSNVWRLYEDGILGTLSKPDVIVFPINEDRKTLETVQELYDLLIARSAKRNMTMIVIGGGILQDITGFTASTLYRGINWVFVPTTLLAQADSCIGSKTSLNYKKFKNLVGTFYPPSEVFIYTPFLTTLEEYDFFSGLGEVVKLHIMGGREKTEEIIELMPDIIRRENKALLRSVQSSLEIKLSYMAEDEFDTGKRVLLNFGHTLGHALESVSNYVISHGQAVLIGMLFANIASRNRGLLSSMMFDFLASKLLLDTIISRPQRSHLQADLIYEAMKKDKKRIGEGLTLVMIKDDQIFVRVDDFTYEELKITLMELTDILGINKEVFRQK